MPSDFASANPRSAPFSVWDEVTFTAGDAEAPRRAAAGISPEGSGGGGGLGPPCALRAPTTMRGRRKAVGGGPHPAVGLSGGGRADPGPSLLRRPSWQRATT